MELYICESSGWSDLLKKQPGLDSNGSGEGSDSCHHFTKPNTGFSRESIPSWPGAILRARRSGNNGYTDTGTVWTCRATWKGYRSEWSPRPPCSGDYQINLHHFTTRLPCTEPRDQSPLLPQQLTSSSARSSFFSHPVHLFSKDVKRTERTIYKRRRAGWNSSALVSVADSRTSGADRRGNTRPKERKPVGEQHLPRDAEAQVGGRSEATDTGSWREQVRARWGEGDHAPGPRLAPARATFWNWTSLPLLNALGSLQVFRRHLPSPTCHCRSPRSLQQQKHTIPPITRPTALTPCSQTTSSGPSMENSIEFENWDLKLFVTNALDCGTVRTKTLNCGCARHSGSWSRPAIATSPRERGHHGVPA
ncbi:unnamed protein product, partial [Nesidiocoris tenuis]